MSNKTNSNTIASHQHFNDFATGKREILSRISSNKDLVAYFEMFSKTTFGEFMVINRGLNAYWTDAIVKFPIMKHPEFSALEQEIFKNFPVFQATQERFFIFKKICQKFIEKDSHVLSAPCGLLPEFLPQDIQNQINSKIDAVDIDPDTLQQLNKKLDESLKANISIIQKDIFSLKTINKYKLIVSNGLNIYLSDPNQVTRLYQIFYDALKQDGILLTSTLIAPNGNEWAIDKIDHYWLGQQKMLFADTLNVAWSCYMGTEEFTTMLKNIGYCDINIIWDSQKMFPTVTAKK